jgi:HTH-type transcriptional regulator/antitoxin HigA
MDIRPIHNETDHEAALARLQTLMDAPPDSKEGEELEVLGTLIEAYETRHFPIGPPDPVDAILFRMDQQGLSRKDLEPYIGHSGRVSEVLNRRRALSLDMIRRLHHALGIPLESLIQPIKTAS